MMTAFSDVFADVTKQGTKLQTSEYLPSGKYPIIDQGQDDIAGYTDREDGLFTDVPAIIFGDHTRIVKYVDMPFFLGADGVKVLKATIPDVDCRYLYYAVSAVKIPNTGYNRHFKWLKEAQIPLPDISTQRRIADTLDKVSEGIEVCRRMLGELDLMVKAKFGEMFGDAHNNSAFPYKNIGDLTTVTSGGTPDRENNLYWDDGDIRWVKTTELQNCTICDTEEKITKLGLENSSAKLVPAGSVLIAMYGQGKTRGMTAYLENESATNQACACILPSSKINQKYLWKYLMLSYDKLRSMAKGGNQPNLNIGIIKNFPVLYPPIELQNQYVEFVIYIDKSILTIKGILAKMEEMKLALMQKCFKEGKHGE